MSGMPSSKRIHAVTEVEKLALRQVYEFFRERAPSIPQVRYIAAYSENSFIHLWTVIPQRDHEAQRKIYDAELELMDQFPTFSYDFNVIFCRGDIVTLLPSEAKHITAISRAP